MKIRMPQGIARWSKVMMPVALLTLNGCDGSPSSGIRILIQNSMQAQLTVFLESDSDNVQFGMNQGQANAILDGDAGEQVFVSFSEDGQTIATGTCTSTARIVGPDDPGVEYGQITIQNFNGPPVVECSSGWVEEII
ncbi:MAG: hypothetical protein AAF389_19030 [Gemmatimonadota bacterium]